MNKSILVVDDETDLLDVYDDFFTSTLEGIQIVKCICVADAISALEKQSFDIIISDYKMPKGDGLSLLTHVRKTLPQIPFLMISGYKEDICSLPSNDANFYVLDKPVKMNNLLEKVENLLKA